MDLGCTIVDLHDSAKGHSLKSVHTAVAPRGHDSAAFPYSKDAAVFPSLAAINMRRQTCTPKAFITYGSLAAGFRVWGP